MEEGEWEKKNEVRRPKKRKEVKEEGEGERRQCEKEDKG